MSNAKEEFLNEVVNKELVCAELKYEHDWNEFNEFNLKKGFTQEEFIAFLKAIDFEYNCGYGSQKLHGYIWYADGSWSSRGEYDGSEWWEHQTCPQIPNELLK